MSEFEVGDRVFGVGRVSARHAEYVCVRESRLVAHMPGGHDLRGGGGRSATARVRALRPAQRRRRRGQEHARLRRLRLVGTAAVQLARHFGAHVTAVCNTKNVELVRSLGADEVIDCLQEDFTKNGETYDVVFDAVGKHSFRRCRRSLERPAGIYIADRRARDNFALAR